MMKTNDLQKEKYKVYIAISCLLMLFGKVFSTTYILAVTNLLPYTFRTTDTFQAIRVTLNDVLFNVDYILISFGMVLFLYSVFRLFHIYIFLDKQK